VRWHEWAKHLDHGSISPFSSTIGLRMKQCGYHKNYSAQTWLCMVMSAVSILSNVSAAGPSMYCHSREREVQSRWASTKYFSLQLCSSCR
jgi:hypothetical protein